MINKEFENNIDEIQEYENYCSLIKEKKQLLDEWNEITERWLEISKRMREIRKEIKGNKYENL